MPAEAAPSLQNLNAPKQRVDDRSEKLRDRLLAQETMKVKDQKEKDDFVKGLRVHERISFTREERIRAKWDKQQRDWDRFKSRMAKKLGRKEGDLVVSHAEDFRVQKEEYDLIQQATPIDQRQGGGDWETQLRGGGTRYIQIGNIFTGLYCPVKEDPTVFREVCAV